MSVDHGEADPRSLPEAIRALCDRARADDPRNAVLCLRLDDSYRLRECHGDAAAFGLGDLLPGMDVRSCAPYLDHFDETGRLTLPFVNIGEDRAVHLHVLPCRSAGTPGAGWYVVFADADEELQQARQTQQRENEQRLKTQRLQGRLVQATAEAQLWRDRAQEGRAAAWRLAGSLSHELKTPLSAIVGYARLLEDALADQPRYRGHVRAIERGAEHIGQLIEATLAQYRRDATELAIHPQPTDLRGLITTLTELMAPLAADKALGFAAFVAPALPERLRIDAMRLRQILLNLLGNAVKFTQDGWVRLDVSWREGQLTVSVADSGPGIAPEHQSRIFEAFERGGQGTQQTAEPASGAAAGGSGLGLAITRDIVGRMGGRIEVESQAGQGSRFTVRVPAEEIEVGGAEETGIAIEPGRVLVAEDDLDLRVLFGVVLERAGFDTRFVTRGDETLREALAHAPQLVLMDLHLEDSRDTDDGLRIVRRLREGGYDGALIAMSAAAEREAAALAAGCDAFVAKPVRPEELLERIFEVLGCQQKR